MINTQPESRRLYGQLLLLMVSIPIAVSAVAQTDSFEVELRRCAAIGRSGDRLDCYDAIARGLGPAEALSSESASTGIRPEPVAAEDAAAPVARDISSFGSELIDDDDDSAVEEIESRIIGEFTGWSGGTVFRLENGQVWRQSGQGRFVYRADSPVVTIRRAALGSYRLRVAGLNRTITVRRIE
jgi:hypothetical protein